MSEADIGVVEGFMIGDAEAYTRIENDFESWTGELGRLVTSLADKSARLQGPLLLDAMGEVEDARRVLGDICNFLEQKERVARYKRTMAQPLDGARSGMLAEILQRQLASAEE